MTKTDQIMIALLTALGVANYMVACSPGNVVWPLNVAAAVADFITVAFLAREALR